MPRNNRIVSADSQRRWPSANSADSACPICLAGLSHVVETNCAHLFCADCFFAYYGHGSPLNPMKCPVCRQQLNCAELESAEARLTARHNVAAYNRRFSGQPREWLEYIRDVPCLLRHLCLEFFSEGGLLLMFRVRVVACFVTAVMYLLSPLDIVPEAFFGMLGLFDDIFIAVLVVLYVTMIYRHYVAERD
ncbi:E3 ubiquitin-protein ligase RNF170-like [Pollicipes pollicipes]|uniref:E3 ubiquitin-protein ligase RNF170-like n=1 Tax=Pollicipes pollicipes TaxID=41117 RepID=UPI0018857A95|nr:E3 ubiquitin-protein ligase RNF170-like [Pollicipes pollicipes]